MIKRIRVTFEMNLPQAGATIEDAAEWIEYNIGARGGLKMDNILEPFDLENAESVIVDRVI